MNLFDFCRNCLNKKSSKKLKDDFFCHSETIIFREFCVIACRGFAALKEEIGVKMLRTRLNQEASKGWIRTAKIQPCWLLKIGLSQVFSKK